MDIFTTQLTRVVPVVIKPEKLKVKSLAKDEKLGKLDQKHDQLDEHELTSVTQQSAQAQYKNKENNENKEHEEEHLAQPEETLHVSADNIEASEHPSFTKAELLQGHTEVVDSSDISDDKQEDKDKAKIKHLDLFV